MQVLPQVSAHLSPTFVRLHLPLDILRSHLIAFILSLHGTMTVPGMKGGGGGAGGLPGLPGGEGSGEGGGGGDGGGGGGRGLPGFAGGKGIIGGAGGLSAKLKQGR